jgi:hypothetical protein
VARPTPRQAWVSAIDGTGTRGCWLVLEGPFGERTLLSAVLSDTTGFLDVTGGPIAKKRLDERLRAMRAESPLAWVEVPPAWALHLFADAGRRHTAAGVPPPAGLTPWQPLLAESPTADTPPIYERLPAASLADDPRLIEASASLLDLPELAGWFLDPPALQSDALELLQARESRLVVSDQIKAERVAALVDRVIDGHFDAEARGRWQRRLEETAFVLVETGRAAEASLALSTALALADAARAARHVPLVRALVEKSLEIAGEIALGRVRADEVSRRPRGREAPRPADAP